MDRPAAAASALCAAVLTACSTAVAVTEPAPRTSTTVAAEEIRPHQEIRPHPAPVPRSTVAAPALDPAAAASSSAPRPTTDPAPAEPKPSRIMVVGDSISTGFYASTAANAYVTVLAGQLRGTVVSKLAVPGATVAQDLALVSRARPTAADVLIVESSTNDAKQHVPPTTTAARYRALLAAAKAKAGQARLLCLGAWEPRPTAAAYDALTAELCQQAGGIFLRLSGLFETAGTRGRSGVRVYEGVRDYFHPNDRGHRAIAALIAAALR